MMTVPFPVGDEKIVCSQLVLSTKYIGNQIKCISLRKSRVLDLDDLTEK